MAINNLTTYFKKPVFISSLFCLFVFYSGIFKIPDRTAPKALILSKDFSEVSGRILSSPSKTSNGKYYSAMFQLETVADKRAVCSSASGRLKIMIPAELAEAYSPGKLSSSSREKGGAYLYETGGRYVFKGKNTESGFYITECKNAFWASSFIGRLNRFRALWRLHFKRLMFGWGEAGGLLLALLCGSREYTSQETADAFRLAGLSHILALSGMHLSMFSAIAIFFGNRAGVKKFTFILRIITLIVFVWFAGFSPSLTRAFICAMLTLCATIAGTEKPDMLSILCFSFLFQSALCPQDIQNAGFILSYGALTGILLTGRIFSRFWTKLMPKRIASSLSAATGAQTFTAPVSLKIFGSFSPIGIISSVIVSPLVTVFIYSGLLLIFISLIFPVLAIPSGIFINFQYTIINRLVKLFSLVPNFHL